MAKKITVSIPGHEIKLLSIFLNTTHSSCRQISNIKREEGLYKKCCDESAYYRDEEGEYKKEITFNNIFLLNKY